jgi:glycosyltransferase involved in cell wall biosynthesis
VKLALVHYTAPPVMGGVEVVLGKHARLLRRARHDVRVIAGRGECELVPELDSRHRDVEALTQALDEGRYEEKAFERLRRRLSAALEPLLEDREIVIPHNVLTMPFNLPAAAALVQSGKRLLAWTHDLAWTNPRYDSFQREGYPWSILREAQPNTRYVAISQVRQKQICKTLGLARRDVPVVPDGVDELEFLGVDRETRRLLRRAGLENAEPLILVPLRVTPRKRLELALEAAAELREKLPQLGVIVTGPLGPHSLENREYANRLLELRGELRLDDVVAFCFEQATNGHPVTDRMMGQLYRVADAVLLPSESEGFGLPVLEGALVRAPVVCSDLDVLREVGGSGLWTFPVAADGAAVAAALTAALGSRISRLRRKVRQAYTWTAVMGQMESLL